MAAYYNEIDLYAAQWLRNLIAAGHIADGVVDTRSIEDVHPADLQDFTQCHFFAGVGVWSLALRLAGWSDDRPVWTGSCPCQPFSAAGQGAGFADERHLWPAFGHLIAQCKPAIVLGEQVASKDVDVWIDLVHADLEALGYAFGSIPFPSAGVGAPHIRDRNYWVANAANQRLDGRRPGGAGNGRDAARQQPERLCDADGLGHTSSTGLDQRERIAGIPGITTGTRAGQSAVRAGIHACGMADAKVGGWREERAHAGGIAVRNFAQGVTPGLVHGGTDLRPGPTNGFWRDADWLGCTDGKWRPVEPGTFPLVASNSAKLGSLRAGWHAPAGEEGQGHRAGRLKAYGNAINSQAAQAWIECVMESL